MSAWGWVVGHQNLDRCPELAVFATSDHDRPWHSPSVASACAGSSACSDPLGGPKRTRISRSWCSATRCVPSGANSMCASPIALWIGRSSPPSRGCWRDGAGAPSSSRQRRSFVGTESSRGAKGGAGDPRVALVGRPLAMSSSSSSSGSSERTGAGAVSASRASFEALAFASRRARSGASFAGTVSALLPAVAVLAAVSRHGSQGHPRHGLVHRRHRVLHPALRALRHRVEESSGAHPQDHRSSRQCLRHPGGEDLGGRSC